MRYALIENNIVKDIFVEPEGISITECFHPSIVDLYIPCPENIIEGDHYDSETGIFTEDENKKLPNESVWILTFQSKLSELATYYMNLNFTINQTILQQQDLELYKSAIEEADNVGETEIALDGKIFSVEDFKNMINNFETYISQINIELSTHTDNISDINNADEIIAYDFTSKISNTAEF